MDYDDVIIVLLHPLFKGGYQLGVNIIDVHYRVSAANSRIVFWGLFDLKI